jgi:hypothetical protein
MEVVANPEKALRRFESALRHVMSVSKDELNDRLAKEKASHEGKPKRGPKPKGTSASAPAIPGKD